MLLMLGNLRIKAFPKIIAILESVLKSPFGLFHEKEIVLYLEGFLKKLAEEENRNKYLISWICYFLVSNDLENLLKFAPKFEDPVTLSIFGNNGLLFRNRTDFVLFVDCKKAAKEVTMLEHLEVFKPPRLLHGTDYP